MNTRDFYRYLLKASGHSTASLARVLRESGRTTANVQSQLSRWSNDPTIVPSMRTMAPVAEYLGVKAQAFYDDAMAESEYSRLTSGSSVERPGTVPGLASDAPTSRMVANITKAKVGAVVPLISWVQAGELNGVEDQYHPGEADEWVVVTDARPGGRSFALRVVGDSMTSQVGDSFPEGTTIIVDPDVSPTPGRYVIAKDTLTQEATFKRLTTDGGRWYLRPLNPAYPTIEIDRTSLRVIGVVVQKQLVQKV